MPTDSPPIRFDRVTAADKPRILEISAGVWDGEDYVPAVLDEWLAADNADLIGAWVGDALVAFAHLVRMSPTYAWFEGLRIDGAWRNRGIGRAFTEHMLGFARESGIRRIGLSVYQDNLASRRVVEAQGFAPVASFIAMELPADRPGHGQALEVRQVRPVAVEDAAVYIAHSRFLVLGHGFFPRNWRFHTFADDPVRVLRQMTHVLGIRREGQWAGLVCTGHGEAAPDAVVINFLEGDDEAMEALARHVLHVSGGAPMEAMVPATDGEQHRALAVLSDLGFKTWFDARPDVFVYERDIGASAAS